MEEDTRSRTESAGGMAIVYKARDTLLNRTVAIKVLREQFASDEGFIRRFRREAQAAASLSHQNIVSIFDVGKDGGEDYIVMEYVLGATLKDIIRNQAPMAPQKALKIARQSAEALAHAHANHIIHRDIKPQNILITSDGRVKVTDFGIARAASAATLTHTEILSVLCITFLPNRPRVRKSVNNQTFILLVLSL
jgi:serine/threonine-protein kinase